MTVLVTPEIQAQYDQNTAEDRAAVAGVADELKVRRAELAEQAAATRAEFAALGEKLREAKESEPPRPPTRPVEDNDISARAQDYQEPDEDTRPKPFPVVRQAVAPRPARDDEEVPSFHWDEDPVPAPKPAAARPAATAREPEEDLSEHDWLE